MNPPPDTAPGPVAGDGEFRVLSRRERYAGPVFRVVTDDVVLPGGQVVHRDYLRHPGAVAVVPYDERGDEIVMVRQYRHPVGGHLWELPAGLVDHAGESPPEVAVRELAEEVDLVCGRLDLLVDLHTTPGCSDERIRIFLARDLRPAPSAHPREHEEATMTVTRFPLDRAVRMVLAGEITNAAAVAGVLATAHARHHGWAPLRPVGSPPSSPAPDRPA
ncbi:MAG TPA: NUDIX hydrolase [Natronosporangium sp.]|nr:NUDIX hydrolase [Natronosporangium sp.]